ncbi:hypothetical protein BE11_26350 [Sorangium cellulosum]|nr:hypothetical protein BE11_26350 [Sorangium cellulosum]
MRGVGGGPEVPTTSDVVDRLVREGDRYDAEAAFILSAASAWAYSDDRTFADMMDRYGVPNECAVMGLSNDALLLTATAYLLRSKDGRLAILCFRGTEPRNLINWLLDASTEKDPLGTIGYLHGGFYRNVLALWPYVLCRLVRTIEGVRPCPDLAPPSCGPDEPEPTTADCPKKPLEALYITGHSLGGAMAVIAAALCFQRDSEPGLPNVYEQIRAKLRGVYTFGQPMVGDKDVAAWGEATFGSKLFTHRYGVDIAPRLLPRTMGAFAPFGRQYVSTRFGWMQSSAPVRQTYTLLASNVLGAVAWLNQQIPALSNVRLPFSWGDHSPLNYMRTSQIIRVGAEFPSRP